MNARTAQVLIRRAEAVDLGWIIELGREFHAATIYGKVAGYDERAVFKQLDFMRRHPSAGVIFVAEGEMGPVGMIGAIINAPWFNPLCLVAQELFWWVTPTARKTQAGALLLAELERWWPTVGAKGLLMLRTPNVAPKVMDRLYRIRGFTPWDGYYMKWGG